MVTTTLYTRLVWPSETPVLMSVGIHLGILIPRITSVLQQVFAEERVELTLSLDNLLRESFCCMESNVAVDQPYTRVVGGKANNHIAAATILRSGSGHERSVAAGRVLRFERDVLWVELAESLSKEIEIMSCSRELAGSHARLGYEFTYHANE